MTPIDTADLERLADECRDMGNEAHQQPGASKYMRTLWKAEALIREVLARRKAEAWQPISSAPKGCITEDVGCRGPSEWFLGRVSPEFRAGRPPFIVIRRKAWPQGDSWECAGEAWYVPRFFDAWRPLPTTPEAEGGCDD